MEIQPQEYTKKEFFEVVNLAKQIIEGVYGL